MACERPERTDDMTKNECFENVVASPEPTTADKLGFAAVALFIVVPIAGSMLLVQYLGSVLSNLISGGGGGS
jgi:hypothetical protein